MARPPREMDEMGRYRCPGPPYKGCGRWLMPHEFYTNIRAKTGISTYCKECHRKKQTDQYNRRAKQRTLEEREALHKTILQEYQEECKDRQVFGLPLRTLDEFKQKMGYDTDA